MISASKEDQNESIQVPMMIFSLAFDSRKNMQSVREKMGLCFLFYSSERRSKHPHVKSLGTT